MRISDWSSDVCSSDLVAASVVIAATARHSAQNIAFHEVGRQAVMADPNWRDGDYYYADSPAAGLAVARMAAHITYLSEAGLTAKFGRKLQDRPGKPNGAKRSEEHKSELQSLMRISYDIFCLIKNNMAIKNKHTTHILCTNITT